MQVSWVNDFVGQLWPRIATYFTDLAWEQIPPALKENRPAWIGDIRMEVFNLGHKPPQVHMFVCYHLCLQPWKGCWKACLSAAQSVGQTL